MTREETKELLPILQAFAEGKTIETRRKPTTDNNGVTKDGWFEFNDWTEMKELEYWVNVEYRIKPETKYRPFANAEDCYQEMLNHHPFGLIKEEINKAFYHIGSFDVANIYVGTTNIIHSYADSLKSFTFADGTPFGVKVEE